MRINIFDNQCVTMALIILLCYKISQKTQVLNQDIGLIELGKSLQVIVKQNKER